MARLSCYATKPKRKRMTAGNKGQRPNRRKSLISDLNPDDLIVIRMKPLQRGVEVRTNVTGKYFDELRLGVKSLSNLAMAGSS